MGRRGVLSLCDSRKLGALFGLCAARSSFGSSAARVALLDLGNSRLYSARHFWGRTGFDHEDAPEAHAEDGSLAS